VTGDGKTVDLVRIIARLNIGGPAIQAITLTKLLEPRGYDTHLVRGQEGRDEGNMDYLARDLGVIPTLVPTMRRDPGPEDVLALRTLVSILRRDRPQIVHTHAAKAGTLGRAAALIAFARPSRRPILVHTFHGHSLTGYFSGRAAAVFRAIERWLAARTDALVAVSNEVRDDLVRLGVGDAERFVVIPLGFDLSPFIADSGRAQRRAALRVEWGVSDREHVVTLVARLVPIKRVDRFLAVARLLATRGDTRFVVVGDGELRDRLMTSADALALADRLVWTGFRRDMPDVYFASDVILLTSDNEGTPVSLIEAQAAAVPVVGSDVGGVRSAVRDGETGFVVPPRDVTAMAKATGAILDDRDLAVRLSTAGRRHAMSSYAVERLVRDHDALYRSLLEKPISRPVGQLSAPRAPTA
jgi:glycosyltransferase involved in cell wall biosynthesis